MKLREVLANEGPEACAVQMIPKLLGAAARRDGADAARAGDGDDPWSPLLAAIDRAIGALDVAARLDPGLAAISCATLVLVGDQDEITPAAEAAS